MHLPPTELPIFFSASRHPLTTITTQVIQFNMIPISLSYFTVSRLQIYPNRTLYDISRQQATLLLQLLLK